MTAVVPTISIKTTSGDWIPRSVTTGTGPGWELALETAEKYSPSQDIGGPGTGTDPPAWVPEDQVNSDLTYFRVPGQLLVSTSGDVDESDYPINPGFSIGGTGLYVDADLTSTTDPDTWDFGLVLRTTGLGQSQSNAVSNFEMSVGTSRTA